MAICNYINGLREGEEKVYYANGQLRWICNYKNGETVQKN